MELLLFLIPKFLKIETFDLQLEMVKSLSKIYNISGNDLILRSGNDSDNDGDSTTYEDISDSKTNITLAPREKDTTTSEINQLTDELNNQFGTQTPNCPSGS